jgi:hypothetical protein
MKDETCFGQYEEGHAECHVCDAAKCCEEETNEEMVTK